MSDERLTDAQLARIAAAVAAYEGRYRWVQLSVDDVRALLDEVRRLRAERDALARDVTRLSGCIDAVMRHDTKREE